MSWVRGLEPSRDGRAGVYQRQAENQQAILELCRTEDQVAADVSQAYAQAQTASQRIKDAAEELQAASESADKNVHGLGLYKLAGNAQILLVRPQEVVAALQTLAQAYADPYAAVADYDRAQFRLYHALGQPAQAVATAATPASVPCAALAPASGVRVLFKADVP